MPRSLTFNLYIHWWILHLLPPYFFLQGGTASARPSLTPLQHLWGVRYVLKLTCWWFTMHLQFWDTLLCPWSAYCFPAVKESITFRRWTGPRKYVISDFRMITAVWQFPPFLHPYMEMSIKTGKKYNFDIIDGMISIKSSRKGTRFRHGIPKLLIFLSYSRNMFCHLENTAILAFLTAIAHDFFLVFPF